MTIGLVIYSGKYVYMWDYIIHVLVVKERPDMLWTKIGLPQRNSHPAVDVL